MKSYYLKIYNRAGTFLSTIKDFQFDGFRSQINAGQGQLTFVLARKFDDFDEDYLIKLNNIVELWVSDKEEPDGINMYTGFITMYNPVIDGNDQSVTVNCIGSVNKLATSILRHGDYLELKTDTTNGLKDSTGDNASAATVQKAVQTIIDRYRSESTNPIINYTASSIAVTSTNITYTFNCQTFKDAIDKCLESAPSRWWWYVGADSILQFKAKASTATHTFIFGRHFKKIDVQKNMENTANNIVVNSNNASGTILKLYTDSTSVGAYDDRWEIKSDNRLDDTTTVDNVGQGELATLKDSDVRTVIEIIDSNTQDTGYDIESVHIGDTCQLIGFNDVTARTFKDANGVNKVLQIVAIDYTLDAITIELESLKPNLSRDAIATQQEVKDIQTSDAAVKVNTDTDGWHEVGTAGEPSFANSWVNFGSTHNTCAFMKDSLGFVHIKGSVKSGTTGNYAFILPVGCRPLKDAFFTAYSFNAGSIVPALVQIASNGAVFLYFGSNNEFHLDNAVFRAEQ